MADGFSFQPIGFMQTPFAGKFGVPRQPGLASAAKGVLKLLPDPDLRTALRSLEEFSHIWVLFVFHEHGGRKWKPSIRPPRLGGARKVGVLASRSPHRPNPIGMSAMALEKVDPDAPGGPEIHVRGVDLLDGTPVLDIKPYLPYADSIPEASAGWASEPLRRHAVLFSAEAEAQILAADPREEKGFRHLIVGIIELDPRPAFQQRQNPAGDPRTWGARYGLEIMGKDVRYEIREEGFWVLGVV